MSPQPPFEVLVASHGAVVLRVCRALAGLQDADDVWQETFLAALRAYPSSADVRNWEAWLVTIARNKAMDHHRKTGRLPIPDGDDALEATGTVAGSGGDAVVHAVEAGETAEQVWAALAKLPPKQREAVVYHHLAGLAYADVAPLLGNSEAAARRAAADGMKSLRAHLVQDREDFS
ncbi:RNA polymerase sigma factor [Arthrobacter sp. GMC3]|uniref:RNA polymerase sigma factor n=1 Tax=Arthrobacter sp. GMC3 TaxID=2058894 RepID=UPI000CE3D90D|nr:RNA polymerase sigma factor [Arthrobacter sp. GMC3]